MTARRIVSAWAAALMACGVLGLSPAASQASANSGPFWTMLQPRRSPLAGYPGMVYDTATRSTVLFGGQYAKNHFPSRDTYSWDGTSWTQLHPATSPRGRFGAAMAYDAATGTAVLFGGNGGDLHRPKVFRNTWTWNGITWTEQAPATSPGPLAYASMAYDAATHSIVLFGGNNGSNVLGDTWSWNGTTWTQLTPATSPPARYAAAVTYDAHISRVVLYGGASSQIGRGSSNFLDDTWTWDGTTWTQRNPLHHPPALVGGGMVYDAAAPNAVLAGGSIPGGLHHRSAPIVKNKSTWIWG
jgi:Galactose oxidase, central domain